MLIPSQGPAQGLSFFVREWLQEAAADIYFEADPVRWAILEIAGESWSY